MKLSSRFIFSLILIGMCLAYGNVSFAENKSTQTPPIQQPVRAPKPVSAVTPSKVYEPKILEIQTELNEIIKRTQELQHQAKADRSEIDIILKRSQIHNQILKKMQQPEPIQAISPKDINRILEREKLRLISEEAERSRKQIARIEKTGTQSGPGSQNAAESKAS